MYVAPITNVCRLIFFSKVRVLKFVPLPALHWRLESCSVRGQFILLVYHLVREALLEAMGRWFSSTKEPVRGGRAAPLCQCWLCPGLLSSLIGTRPPWQQYPSISNSWKQCLSCCTDTFPKLYLQYECLSFDSDLNTNFLFKNCCIFSSRQKKL